MDSLPYRHGLSMMLQEKGASEEERRAYQQFARRYFVQVRMTLTESGARNAVGGFPR